MENEPSGEKEDGRSNTADVSSHSLSFDKRANKTAIVMSELNQHGQKFLKDALPKFRKTYEHLLGKLREAIDELSSKEKKAGKNDFDEKLRMRLLRKSLDDFGDSVRFEIIPNYLKSLALVLTTVNDYFHSHIEEQLKDLRSDDCQILKKIRLEDNIHDMMLAELDPEFIIDLDCSQAVTDEYLKPNRRSFLDRSNIISVVDMTESDIQSNLFNQSNKFNETIADVILVGRAIQKKKLWHMPKQGDERQHSEYAIFVKDFRPISCFSVEISEGFAVGKDVISFVTRNPISNAVRCIRYHISQRLEQSLNPIRFYTGINRRRNVLTKIEEFKTENFRSPNATDTWVMILHINENDPLQGTVMNAVVSLFNTSRQNQDREQQVVYSTKLKDYTPQQIRKIKLKKSDNNLAVILFLNDSDFVYFSIPSASLQTNNQKQKASIKHHVGNLPREENVTVYEVDLCATDPSDKDAVKIFRVTSTDTIVYAVAYESSDKISVTQLVPRDPQLNEMKSPIEAVSNRIYSMKHYVEIFNDYKLYVFACTASLQQNQASKKTYSLYVNFFDAAGLRRDFTFTSWLHYEMNHISPPKIFVQNTQPPLVEDSMKQSRFVWVVTASLVMVVFEISVDASNKRDVQQVAGPSQINLGDLPKHSELELIGPLQKTGQFPGLVALNTTKRQLQTIELLPRNQIQEHFNNM
jgi:hypothetical protein